MENQSIAAELEKLAKLRDAGILTELEFEKEKARVLNQPGQFQPTFVIQNSAAASSAASAVAVRKSSFLSRLIKLIIVLVLFFLFMDFLVWHKNNPELKPTAIESAIPNDCDQAIKDSIYFDKVRNICFTNGKDTRFKSNLTYDNFTTYFTNKSCPSVTEEYAAKTIQEISNLIDGEAGSISNSDFCQRELSYYQSVAKKYKM